MSEERESIENVYDFIFDGDCYNVVYVYKTYWDEIQKKLKALEIIRNILKHTSHFRLGERRNFGEDQKTSYYLIISCGAGECEYKLKNKEEYDTLKEIL